MTPFLIAAWAVCLAYKQQSGMIFSTGNVVYSNGQPAEKPRDTKDDPTYYGFPEEFTGCTRIQDTRNAELARAKSNRDTADALKVTAALESLGCKP